MFHLTIIYIVILKLFSITTAYPLGVYGFMLKPSEGFHFQNAPSKMPLEMFQFPVFKSVIVQL